GFGDDDVIGVAVPPLAAWTDREEGENRAAARIARGREDREHVGSLPERHPTISAYSEWKVTRLHAHRGSGDRGPGCAGDAHLKTGTRRELQADVVDLLAVPRHVDQQVADAVLADRYQEGLEALGHDSLRGREPTMLVGRSQLHERIEHLRSVAK